MEHQVAIKVKEIMLNAAIEYKASGKFFSQCVSEEFWKAFGKYEQSPLMQDVYCVLSSMEFTPYEWDQE